MMASIERLLASAKLVIFPSVVPKYAIFSGSFSKSNLGAIWATITRFRNYMIWSMKLTLHIFHFGWISVRVNNIHINNLFHCGNIFHKVLVFLYKRVFTSTFCKIEIRLKRVLWGDFHENTRFCLYPHTSWSFLKYNTSHCTMEH